MELLNRIVIKPSKSPTTMREKNLTLLFLFFFMIAIPIFSSACVTDGDCRFGETCFKREKRASGICYSSIKNRSEEPVDRKPITGEIRDRAIKWLGDPEQIIEENLPNKKIGSTCIVSTDCPSGFQCVLAGFEGRCVEF
tara:strand:- start:48 stop:464 length:417 start_codon:yes stop_codon:yes gene_type:complete